MQTCPISMKPDLPSTVLRNAALAVASKSKVKRDLVRVRSAAPRVFGRPPRWTKTLLWFGNTFVAPFCVTARVQKNADKGSAHNDFYPVYPRGEQQIEQGSYDRCLGFRFLFEWQPNKVVACHRLTTPELSHGLFGCIADFLTVAFHKQIARSVLSYAL